MYLLQQVFIIYLQNVILQHGYVSSLIFDLLSGVLVFLIFRDQLTIFSLLVFKLKIYFEKLHFCIESLGDVFVFSEINESISLDNGAAPVILIRSLLDGLLEHVINQTPAILFSDDVLIRLNFMFDLVEVNERTTLFLGEVGQLTLRIAVILRNVEIIVTVEMIAEQLAILLNHNIILAKIRDVLGTLLAITEIVEVA